VIIPLVYLLSKIGHWVLTSFLVRIDLRMKNYWINKCWARSLNLHQTYFFFKQSACYSQFSLLMALPCASHLNYLIDFQHQVWKARFPYADLFLKMAILHVRIGFVFYPAYLIQNPFKEQLLLSHPPSLKLCYTLTHFYSYFNKSPYLYQNYLFIKLNILETKIKFWNQKWRVKFDHI
jgi:hypothetical protein